MPEVFLHCREEDMRHVKINCRCGQQSVAEIAKQVVSALNIHICPRCEAVYSIQQRSDGNVLGVDGTRWQVARERSSVRTESFQNEPVRPPNTYSFHCGYCKAELTLEQFMSMGLKGTGCPSCGKVMREEDRRSMFK
jgi:hypothetical protein